MLQKVDEKNPPTDRSAIQAFEHKHALDLPEAYKVFLLHTNGGRPHPGNFPIADLHDNPYGLLHFLYGLGANHECYDLDIVLSEMPASIPNGIVPIGSTDYEGTEIVLDLRDDGAPVKYFDSIPFWGNNIWSEAYLYPVADNFEGLLASLVTDEEAGLVV